MRHPVATKLVPVGEQLTHGVRKASRDVAGREERRRNAESVQHLEQSRESLLHSAIAREKRRAILLEIDSERDDAHGHTTSPICAIAFVRSAPPTNAKFSTRSTPAANRGAIRAASGAFHVASARHRFSNGRCSIGTK